MEKRKGFLKRLAERYLKADTVTLCYDLNDEDSRKKSELALKAPDIQILLWNINTRMLNKTLSKINDGYIKTPLEAVEDIAVYLVNEQERLNIPIEN